nr:MAG TPA: hypothetical protein [Caudoviricetes sp.]
MTTRNKDYLHQLSVFRKKLASRLKEIKANVSRNELRNMLAYSRMNVNTIDEFIDEKRIPSVQEIITVSKQFSLPLPELTDIRTAYAIIYEKILIFARVSDNITNFKNKNALSVDEISNATKLSASVIYALINLNVSKYRFQTAINYNDKLRVVDSSIPDVQVRDLEDVFRDVDEIMETKESLDASLISKINIVFNDEIDVLLGRKPLDSIRYAANKNLRKNKDNEEEKVEDVGIVMLGKSPKDMKKLVSLATLFNTKDADSDNQDDDNKKDKKKDDKKKVREIFTETQRKLQEKCMVESNSSTLSEYEIGFRDGYFKALRDNGLLPERVK